MATVLIMEDEAYTLEFLELLVSKHPLVEEVIAVNNSQSAVAAAKSYSPQVALLDVELGSNDSYNGIQTAKIIASINPGTVFVFVTGYGKYALDAYSAHPYDYLLKPIQKEKLTELLTEIISNLHTDRRTGRKVIIKVKEGTIMIDPHAIACIEKRDRKSIIHTSQDSYETSYNLNQFEDILPPHFVRVHNSYIINLTRILMVKNSNSRSFEIMLEDCPVTALMSRKIYEEHRHLFLPSWNLSYK